MGLNPLQKLARKAGDAVGDAVGRATGGWLGNPEHGTTIAGVDYYDIMVTQPAAAQAAANALPDDFDLLIREAMFASLDKKPVTARQSTFTAGPRGLEGPAGAAADLTVPGSLPSDKDDEDLYLTDYSLAGSV
jgi:hypothetical protein